VKRKMKRKRKKNSLRREKVKWAGRAGSALPGFIRSQPTEECQGLRESPFERADVTEAGGEELVDGGARVLDVTEALGEMDDFRGGSGKAEDAGGEFVDSHSGSLPPLVAAWMPERNA
jgi:hypothetical protein